MPASVYVVLSLGAAGGGVVKVRSSMNVLLLGLGARSWLSPALTPSSSCRGVLPADVYALEPLQGITGFGNAIINLLVWVTFNAFGVDGGSLKQAVLADTVGCMVAGIPLLIMTKAHKTADWRLVIAILAFTVGTPASLPCK